MYNQEHQSKCYTNQKNRTLNKVCPKNRFQSTRIRVDNCNHAHDNNQEIYADTSQTSKYHTWKIHNNRHTANLVNDKHHCSQNTKPFAAKPQFQIMICCINIQFAVNWKEKLNCKWNCKQHTKLCKPHDPCSCI